MSRHLTLLNPGPANLTPGVRAALTLPDLCHREDEYRAAADDVRQALGLVYGAESRLATEFSPVFFAGSGTMALEAMLGSLVPPNERVLVLANGVYGDRLGAICRALGLAHEVIDLGWLGAIDADAIAKRLRERPHQFVAMVHNETTTGRLNPLAVVDAICAERGSILLVDAVSSFGAEVLAFDAVGGFAASSNKCLHGPAGLAIVHVRRDLLDRAATRKPRSLALHLPTYDTEWPPFTPPVQIVLGLRAALAELGTGGAEGRRARYQRLADRVRDGAIAAGFELLLPRGVYASMITSFRIPDGLAYPDLHAQLKRLGYVIYAGQGDLSRSMFRIANMGALCDEDLDGLLLGLAAARRAEPAATH